jgi:16S rRNA processing protein RimM
MAIYSHFPERIPTLRRVYLGDERTARRVVQAQLHPPHALLKLTGLDTPEAVQPFREALVRIDHSQAAPLPPGEYYHWQIIGAAVVGDTGASLGVVAEIIETGANDVYVVRGADGREVLLPAIGDVLRHVDTERGVITVHLLPGLIEPPVVPDATDSASTDPLT